MSIGNVGDLRVGLVLDLNAYNQGLQTAQKLATMFSQNINNILKLKPPTFASAQFDAEIKKLDTSLKKYETDLQKTTTAEKQAAVSKQQLSVSTVRLNDVFSNVGLRVQGFRSILVLLKSTLGDLMSEYGKQEVALAKLENGLRNVGESNISLKKLTTQSTELQKITPFSDESINDAQATLTTFQKTSDEIEILIPRILDLTAARMKDGDTQTDLSAMARVLGKVNEENLQVLKRYGIIISDTDEKMLKSLDGTKQAEYLAGLLDARVKGMAETFGKTSPGQLLIFKNKIGEVKEALGEIIVKGLLPILQPLGSLMQWLQNAPPAVQRLTIVVLALAVAFVTLNTSLGALPYIIGGVAGAIYALAGNMSDVEKKVASANEEMLKNQKVTEDMKKVLDETKVSADNMSEAYDNLGNAILTMTNKQLKSAEQFILAEIAKNEALVQTMTTMRLNIPDFVAPDFGESMENSMELAVAPQMEKLKTLLDQIRTKMKFTPPDETKTSKGEKKKDDAEEKEREALDEFLKGQSKKISALDFEIEMGTKLKASKLDLLGTLREELKTYSEQLTFAKNREAAEDKITEMTRERRRINKQLGDEMSKTIKDVEEFQKKSAKDKVEDEKTALEMLRKLRLQLIKDEYEAKLQKINDDYDAEVEKINKLKIDELEKNRLIWTAQKLREKQIEELDAAKTASMYDKIVSNLEKGVGLIAAMRNGLNDGGKSFLYWLQAALTIAIEIAKLQKKSGSDEGLEIGDIFGFIGTILPFLFAGGGEVPGSGSGDTVPAWLTPGEVIVPVPRVNQLVSEYGNDIVPWLIGRRSILPAIMGRYGSGGIVMSPSGGSGKTIIMLNGRPLDAATKRKIASEGMYLESLSVGRSDHK